MVNANILTAEHEASCADRRCVPLASQTRFAVNDRSPSGQPQSSGNEPHPLPTPATAAAAVTMFVCANSARPGVSPTSGMRQPPVRLAQSWPFPAREVMVPCAGKLQPEHLLKAFEAGADLVCVVACAGDNCHTMEGSRRAQRRVEYVRSLLDEVGVGKERLLLVNFPGSAREDMGAARGNVLDASGAHAQQSAGQLADLSKTIADKLKVLGASPLRRSGDPI
jgi:coenzyme F420-reducing hydrogenase delta subunit